jgi:hypothetical protein
MTKSTNLRAGLRTRLPAVLNRLLVPTVAVSALLLVAGLVAVLTDHDGLALAMALLLQGCVLLAVVTHHLAATRLQQGLGHRIDQASARQLADLARTRHALLSTFDGEPEEPR